jgi:hypothetical protein
MDAEQDDQPVVPKVELVSTRSAQMSATQLVLADHKWFYLDFAERALLDEPLLHEVNGLVEIRRSSAAVLTGCHTCYVAVHVERHDTLPPLELDGWDEAAEFSLEVTGSGVDDDWGLRVMTFMEGEPRPPFPELTAGPGSYRVRVQARDRDPSRVADDLGERLDPPEQFAILVWPSPPDELHVLKLTDETGRHTREYVPPPRPEPEEPILPGATGFEPLQAKELLSYAPWLVYGIATATEMELGALARSAARKAIEIVPGLADFPWMQEVLTAMDDGRPLPDSYDSQLIRKWLREDPSAPKGMVPMLPTRAHVGAEITQANGVMSPRIAVTKAPRAAALWCLCEAMVAYGGEQYPLLLAQVRRAFPELARRGDVEEAHRQSR